MANALSVEVLEIFLVFCFRDLILDFRHLSSDYSYCGREPMEPCKLCVECCTLSSANCTGARVCAANHGMALKRISASGKIMLKTRKIPWSGKYFKTPLPLALIPCFYKLVSGLNTISALRQFFPTLPIIWAQEVAKPFLQNPRWWPLKIKKECPAPQHKCTTRFKDDT
jgi:hypothetical protein